MPRPESSDLRSYLYQTKMSRNDLEGHSQVNPSSPTRYIAFLLLINELSTPRGPPGAGAGRRPLRSYASPIQAPRWLSRRSGGSGSRAGSGPHMSGAQDLGP